ANCNCCEAKVSRCTVVQQAFPILQFGVTREQKFIADRAAGPAPRSIARGSFSSPIPNRLNAPACARARFAAPVKPKCSSCRIQFQCLFDLSEVPKMARATLRDDESMNPAAKNIKSIDSAKSAAAKVTTLDWERVSQDLDAQGSAVIEAILSPEECQALVGL